MPTTDTAPAPPAAPSHGGHHGPRRFGQHYAHFNSVGVVLRDPRLVANRRGGATASFSVVIAHNRDLDILVAGRDLADVQGVVQGVRAGVTVTIDGFIIAPRINQREVPQFYAEHVTAHAPDAQAAPKPEPRAPGPAAQALTP